MSYNPNQGAVISLSVDGANTTIRQIDSVGQAMANMNTRVGASAAQIANAMRMVPAQLTDIAVGLQGGQAPLTVLLQQGGQLRDMFGSVGGALRGVATSLLSLVTPYTVGAAAVFGLGMAYKTGAEESSVFAKALATSGNAAGATIDQLANLSRQIGAVSGSQGAAAEALAALASTGQVSIDNMKQFGSIAVDLQRVLGRSVADTAADFAELGKSPLAALDKMSEKYHFVTAATYAQVKALQDQGRAAEAADVAQKAYADAMDHQRQKVLDGLTDWERGWIRIKNAISGAVDAAIDFAGGRDKTNSEKIDKLLDDREGILENLRRAQKRNLTANIAEYQAELAANKRSIDVIRAKDKATKDSAKDEGDANQVSEARIKWMKDGEQYLSRSAQLEKAITKARNEGAAAHLAQSEIDKRVAAIQKSYSDIYNASIDSTIAAMKRRDEVAGVLEQRELQRIQAQRTLGGMTEVEAINATATAELAAFDRKKGLIEAEIAQTKRKANSVTALADLNGQLAVLDEQRRSRAIQQENDLLILADKRARLSEALYIKGVTAATAETESIRDLIKAQKEHNEQIGLSATALADLEAARLEKRASDKEETADALEKFEAGSLVAQGYRDQAAALRELANEKRSGATKQAAVDTAKEFADAWKKSSEQIGQSLTDNLMRGGKSAADYLKDLFRTMVLRPVIAPIGSIFGGATASLMPGTAQASTVSGSTDAIGAVQAASGLYKAISGGFSTLTTGVADAVQAGLYQSGLSTQIASNGTFATGAGWAAGTIGGYMAGSALNSAISGKYETGSGVMKVEKIATAVASAFGPELGVIAGAISGLVNRAFGMGPKDVTSQGIRGTLSATSLAGTNYADWHQDGGWFRSDKNGTDTKALTDSIVAQFTQGLSSIELASSGFASALGVSADWIKDYSKTFDLKLSGDASKDQQTIADFFQGIGDEIATKLVPNLDTFTKSGETASATLQRLASDFQVTDQVAQLIGKSAAAVFGAVGMESAKARERLVELAGGANVLGQQASFYAQNFLSEAQRLAPVQKALDEAMAGLGLSAVQTRDQFKGVVDSLDLTTEAGEQQFTAMMKLAEAFAQVHPAADAAAAAVDQAAAALQAMKDSASALIGGVNDAYSALQKVVDREKKAQQTAIDAQTAAVSKLQGLSQALRSSLDSYSIPGQDMADRARAQAEIRADLAITKAGGSLSDSQIDSLKKALGIATKDASSQFGTYADYLRDAYQTKADIAQLAGVTDSSLSVEQRSLTVLQDQLGLLDNIVTNGREQIDALTGQSVATLSLAQALAGFQSSVNSAKTNPIVSGTSIIAGFYQDLLGRAPDQAGLAYWQDVLAKGNSLDSIRAGFMEGDEYKKLHPFAVGTNFVPKTMPALVHEGERIIPAADNRVLMSVLARADSGSSGNAGLLAEVQSLRREIQGLREEARAIAVHTMKTEKNTGRSHEILDNAFAGGYSPLMVEIAKQ